MRVLAVDYGKARTGLAVCDAAGILASPAGVIEERSQERLVEKIAGRAAELRAERPDARFWFILGMDSVRDFPRWHRAGELAGLCAFIAFDRPGVEPPGRPFDPRLLAHRLRGPFLGASSTAIRRAVARDGAFRYPMDVLAGRYLRARRLYQGAQP